AWCAEACAAAASAGPRRGRKQHGPCRGNLSLVGATSLPTVTASLAIAAPSASEKNAAVLATSWQKRGKRGKRGGKGGGRGGGRASRGTSATGGGDSGGGAGAASTAPRGANSGVWQGDSSSSHSCSSRWSSRVSSSNNSSSSGDLSTSGDLRSSGDRVVRGASAAAAALQAVGLVAVTATLGPASTRSRLALVLARHADALTTPLCTNSVASTTFTVAATSVRRLPHVGRF
ncbi:unnamed protein product, partial [Closterium sp. NIES-54]